MAKFYASIFNFPTFFEDTWLARDWLSVAVTDTRVTMEESASIDIPVSITRPANTDVSSSTGGLSVVDGKSHGTSDASAMADYSVAAAGTGLHSAVLGDYFCLASIALVIIDLVTLAETMVGLTPSGPLALGWPLVSSGTLAATDDIAIAWALLGLEDIDVDCC